MDRHTPWTTTIRAVLQALGASRRVIETIRAHQTRLCADEPRTHRLRLTPRAQAVLTKLGADAPTLLNVASYLDELTFRRYGTDDERQELRKKAAAEAKQRQRDANRAAYNAYQKQYMQQYRARKRAAKAAAAALAARTNGH